MAVLGPVDGPGAVMVGYLDKLSMTGLVKVWAGIAGFAETPRVCAVTATVTHTACIPAVVVC